MLDQIRCAFGLVDVSNRPWILAYVVSALLASILEATGLAIVYAFFQVALSPEDFGGVRAIALLHGALGTPPHGAFLSVLSLIVIAAFVFRSALLLLSAWIAQAFRRRLQYRLSSRLFRKYLSQSQAWHLKHEQTKLISNVAHNVGHIAQHVIVASLDAFSAGLVLLALLCTMFIVKHVETIAVTAALGLLTVIYLLVMRKYLSHWGQERVLASQGVWRSASEPLRGFKTVKVMGLESYFSRRFDQNVLNLLNVTVRHALAQQAPKFLLEAIIICGVLLSVSIAFSSGISAATIIPSMAMFAAATIRVIPQISGIMNSFQYFRISKPALDSIYDDVVFSGSNSTTSSAALPGGVSDFKTIRLTDVSYAYPGAGMGSLKNVSLSISKGEQIALVGLSGAGKTTLADIVLGLLSPSEGTIDIDGKQVDQLPKELFAYIPQESFIIRESVAQNIALGKADIDYAALHDAIAKAELNHVVDALPDKLDGIMHENGNLSGGERQRLGIARALYTKAPILVMDEPTSALDSITEANIIQEVEAMRGDRTVIMITHRLSAVKSFDKIVFLEKGRIVATGTFSELYNSNARFKTMVDYLSFTNA